MNTNTSLFHGSVNQEMTLFDDNSEIIEVFCPLVSAIFSLDTKIDSESTIVLIKPIAPFSSRYRVSTFHCVVWVSENEEAKVNKI